MKKSIFSEFPEIITDRLILREINQEDAESIYKILSDPDVIKYDSFELFTEIEQAENLIKWFSEDFNQKQSIFWGICLKENSEIIGFCRCKLEILGVRASIGYDLNRDFWNMGIMTETLKAVTMYAFNTADINRIEATVATQNSASVRVLEKLGFVKEGILRERSYMSGTYHDMVMLSLLKREYDET